MGLALDVKMEFLPGGNYVPHYGVPDPMTEPGRSHITSSFAQGVKRCIIPLRDETDGPAEYRVSLCFPLPAASKASVDIKLQGNVVAKGVESTGLAEFAGIRVDRNLEVELVSQAGDAPVLSGLEVLCADKPSATEARQVTRR